MTKYVATRHFPNARSEEDAAMASWRSASFSVSAHAAAALAEHIMDEAASWQKLSTSSGSSAMAEGALELARLAGIVQAMAQMDFQFPKVTTASGVVYEVRKIG